VRARRVIASCVCWFLGCGATSDPGSSPGTALPPPAASERAEVAEGPEIPLPTPTRGARPMTGFQVLEGPCAWNDLMVESRPAPIWRIEAAASAVSPPRIAYGTPPPGFVTTIAPAPLADGCYCALAEPCCDARGEFEVSAGALSTRCTRWSTAALPLPQAALNAYEFTPGSRSECLWRVGREGQIEEFALDAAETFEEAEARLPRARWTARLLDPAPGPPLAFGGDPAEPAAPSDWLPASRVALDDGAGSAVDARVRWLGFDRTGTLGGGVLISPEDGSLDVRLLQFDMIHGEGVNGLLAHAVGDVDGDGLADLAVALDPCLDECSDDARGVMVEAFLTGADAGWSRVTLEGRSALDSIRERALGELAEDFDTPSSTGWGLTIAPGTIEARLRGPGGGRAWTLRLEGGRLSRSFADLPPRANAGSNHRAPRPPVGSR
jgi:hypothetical protein